MLSRRTRCIAQRLASLLVVIGLSVPMTTSLRAEAQPPRVLASIKPLHGLAASIMAGVAEPALLLDGPASPHSFSLRPSQAGLIRDADIVVWTGPMLEGFLERPLADRDPASVLTVTSLQLPVEYEIRDIDWMDGAEHPDDHDHAEGGIDPHVWLAVANAEIIARELTKRLTAIDPGNAQAYETNLEGLLGNLAGLDSEIGSMLAPVREVAFVTFHDAYRYLVEPNELRQVGSIAIDPDRQAGARHVAALRERLVDDNIACLFTEPQFEPRLARMLVEGTQVRLASLDPLGADVAAGPGAYEAILRDMAMNMASCLSGEHNPSAG